MLPKSLLDKIWAWIWNRFPTSFFTFLGSLKTEKTQKSWEGLLKIKVAACVPGTHFLSKTASFGAHFGSKNNPKNDYKRIKKLDAKIYNKCTQKDPKTTPKWLPKSTPGAPKWYPSV